MSKKQKPDSELTLSEISNELRSIPTRLGELKIARDKWVNMPLSRAELHEKAKEWFSQKTEKGASDLIARLRNSGFLTGGDLPDPAILLNGSSGFWESNKVDAQGIVTIFAPIIARFVSDWVAALPESEVGTATRDERDAAIASIDDERAALIDRRAKLKRLLADADSAATQPGFNPASMLKGGAVTVDFERLERKFFESSVA